MRLRLSIYLVLLLILPIFLIGCNTSIEKLTVKDDSNNIDISSLITELEELGYYKYTDADKINSVKNDCIEAGYIYGWEDTNRDFYADAEYLAEGGICDFFNTIKPFLEKQNIYLKNINQDFSDKGYVLTIDNQDYIIYSSEEVNSEELWEVTANRTCAIINKLLEDADSSEKAYMLYGGNDLQIIFLTDEIYNTIIESKKISNDEKPIKVN